MNEKAKQAQPDANRDQTVEDTYWREQYASRPYVKPGAPYDEY